MNKAKENKKERKKEGQSKKINYLANNGIEL